MKVDPPQEIGSNDGDAGWFHDLQNHRDLDDDRGRDDHDAHGFERKFHGHNGYFHAS